MRKFLVDHGVLPLFEKNVCMYALYLASAVRFYELVMLFNLFSLCLSSPDVQLKMQLSQDHPVDTWGDKTQSSGYSIQQTMMGDDCPAPMKRASLFIDHDSHLESQISRSSLSLYGPEPAVSGLRSPGLGRAPAAIISQVLYFKNYLYLNCLFHMIT